MELLQQSSGEIRFVPKMDRLLAERKAEAAQRFKTWSVGYLALSPEEITTGRAAWDEQQQEIIAAEQPTEGIAAVSQGHLGVQNYQPAAAELAMV